MSMLEQVKGKSLNNERGAEVAEVGIWLALIVALSIALITTLGGSVKAAFQSIVTAMG